MYPLNFFLWHRQSFPNYGITPDIFSNKHTMILKNNIN